MFDLSCPHRCFSGDVEVVELLLQVEEELEEVLLEEQEVVGVTQLKLLYTELCLLGASQRGGASGRGRGTAAAGRGYAAKADPMSYSQV